MGSQTTTNNFRSPYRLILRRLSEDRIIAEGYGLQPWRIPGTIMAATATRGSLLEMLMPAEGAPAALRLGGVGTLPVPPLEHSCKRAVMPYNSRIVRTGKDVAPSRPVPAASRCDDDAASALDRCVFKHPVDTCGFKGSVTM